MTPSPSRQPLDPDAPAGFGADAVARAEAALQALSTQFDAWMEAELQRIEAAHTSFVAAPGPERLAELHTCAHDLKGLAATYGHPLAGRAAASLCRLVEPPRESPPPELVAAHVEALRTLVDLRTEDEDHPLGAPLCEALERRAGGRD